MAAPHRLIHQARSNIFPDNITAQHALSESQFVPFFQPLVTLRTGKLAGFEVLARWRHPTKGLIPPDRFIPMAEKHGWIGALTRQILKKALDATSGLPGAFTIAVNISPLQLRDLRLPGEIQAIAAAASFPLSRLVIEITETALIDNHHTTKTVVDTLKSMGCRLALDDFGTGYSSLHHLQSLPFDELKVDRSFVSSMTEKRDSRKIVGAVVGLGQSLGLVTVAEGIETQEQAEMMLWLGCDLGQGYFYGRPLPPEEFGIAFLMPRENLPTTTSDCWQRKSASNLNLSPSQRLAQLQAVYDGSPVGLAFVDHCLRYVNLNKRLADMNGASVEKHLGSYVSDMSPEFYPQIEPYIRRALRGEASSEVEATAQSSGRMRLLSFQPALDEAGEVVGVAIAATEITERRRDHNTLIGAKEPYMSAVQRDMQIGLT